ncbi:hypothetical protein N7532_004126 [Penicillium argentinense]|uniref:Peptidase A1 domain-containing protein n=1 Tax=Penicillium argentinense TaxID=1131581 RepID=A0A9W9FPD2_9EURO|nr:uncharacterized protein N7532_004126 [Penicillium argentinense]KAJ5103597.1 hypothetical protein N7532_004126 [Penicillium argentinense]
MRRWPSADGYHFSIDYADGTGQSGPLGTEDVTIGSVTINSPFIGVPNDVRTNSNAVRAGCLGMAPNAFTMAPQDEKTWHQNAESTLDQPLWTVDFHNDKHGPMDFGFIDVRTLMIPPPTIFLATPKNPPDFVLGFENGGSVMIPGSMMIEGTAGDSCRGALYITDSDRNLGSAMFNSNLVVFSQTNQQVGFALKP